MKLLGADGCPGGWVAMIRSSGRYDSALYADLGALWREHRDARRIFIDIPIGLREDGGRKVEQAARALIPSLSSSVFNVPTRQAAYARSHRAASALNRAAVGSGLSLQSWHLCAKIRQMETLITREAGAGDRFAECHPEICYRVLRAATSHGRGAWSADSGRALRPKKSVRGSFERLVVLRRLDHDLVAAASAALERYQRKLVGRDDVLDAAVLVAVASLPDSDLFTVPASPTVDRNGRPMVMWLPRPPWLEPALPSGARAVRRESPRWRADAEGR